MSKSFESSGHNIKSSEQFVDEVILEVDARLNAGRFESYEEKEHYLNKLYGVRGITNSEAVRALIKYIEGEYK